MDQPLEPMSRTRRTKLAVGGLVIALTLGFLVMWAMTRSGATSFYVTTSELISIGPTTGSEQVRVNGKVVPDSISRRGLATTFSISDGTTAVLVATRRPLPDAFKEHSDVVALGRYDGERFTAVEVLAKCPSKFKSKG